MRMVGRAASTSCGTGSEASNGKLRLFLYILSSFLVGKQVGCSFGVLSLVGGGPPLIGGDGQPSPQQQPYIGENLNHLVEQGFQLAYEQSFGFFDTISDEEWKMRQSWARNATHHRYLGHPRRLWETASLWYYNNYDPTFSCPLIKRIKGIGDGPKWTCDPHRLRLVVERRKQQLQQQQATSNAKENNHHCLIYSIGSNGNYQWEDGMFKEIGPICEIHIFDYSQNYTRSKNQRQNMHFHQWGLQGSHQDRNGGTFLSFFQILERLGHTGRIIDIFKIDCEGCEWQTYNDWIHYPGIRQVLVETHKLPKNKTMGLDFFDSFERNNLLMYSKEVNPWGGGDSLEFSFLKLHPDFLNNQKPT
jgi:Methyltransferase domain